MIPYASVRKLGEVEAGREGTNGFPYVVHKGKKLFFPKKWTPARALKCYREFVERENITSVGSDGYLRKMPHQYQSEKVHVKKGDVVVDVGAAEGLFSLDVAELASKIYLFENDPLWFPALERTFEPFASKTTIIRKTVGACDSRKSILLSTALQNDVGKRTFVKMDIEGGEVGVIEGSRDFLREGKGDIQLACCTYHRKDDATVLERIFREEGFETEFSDGYMLVFSRRLDYPYFRKGIIRAWRAR